MRNMFLRSGYVRNIIVYIAIVFARRIEAVSSVSCYGFGENKCDCITQEGCHFISLRRNIERCYYVGQCDDDFSMGPCTRGNKDNTYYLKEGRLCASKELEDVGDCTEDTSYKTNISLEISSCAGVKTTIDKLGLYEFTLETAPLTWGKYETYKYYDLKFFEANVNFRIKKDDFPTEGQVVRVIAEMIYRENQNTHKPLDGPVWHYREFYFHGMYGVQTPTSLTEQKPPDNFQKDFETVVCPMEYCFPTIFAGEIRRIRLIRFLNQK